MINTPDLKRRVNSLCQVTSEGDERKCLKNKSKAFAMLPNTFLLNKKYKNPVKNSA